MAQLPFSTFIYLFILVWAIFKAFIEFVTILLLLLLNLLLYCSFNNIYCFYLFDCTRSQLQHVGSSSLTQGLNPGTLHWEHRVLSTGPRGKSPIAFVLSFGFFDCKICGILAPLPGMDPSSPALRGEVVTPPLSLKLR